MTETALALGLIDSGIDENVFPIAGRRVFVEPETGRPHPTIVHDHGTELARMIAGALAPTPVRLYDAQVFGAQLATDADCIAAALDWLAVSRVAIANMSFGLHEDRPTLRAACRRAQEAGVVLVAATPIVGAAVYPAAYPGIIRVSGDARCTGSQWSYFGDDAPRFGTAPAAPENDGRIGPPRGGSSYACARLSAQILRFLAEGVAVNEVVPTLIRQASVAGAQTRPRPQTPNRT